MMIGEPDALLAQRAKRGREFRRNKVRPHAVPDHKDEILGAARSQRGGRDEEQDQPDAGQTQQARTHGLTIEVPGRRINREVVTFP